jgi:Heparinase II/III-like protein/Heparinase II/III N-terminus
VSVPTVSEAVYRLRRVPPRRLPVVVGRYAWRVARTRARRWRIQRNRGELPDSALRRSLRGTSPQQAFDAFVKRFFVDPVEARRRARAVADAYPECATRTRAAAQQALQHVVDLLGSGPTPLGRRIDWHRDFKTGLAWPGDVLADDQDYLRLGEPCDVKMPWELSRCHHWVTLGRAYALEANADYAREFVDQLEAWLDDNPWPYGVNWGRAMEVAVRAVNWVWAAALFADAPEFSATVKQRFLKAMLQHANHIIDNLEYAGTNGNHYLSNGVGLVFLGVLFAEFAQAADWRKKGFEIVWGEMEHQVHPDGVDFEQGIGYQGLVAEFWYSSVLLCERNDVPVRPTVRERLERMFDFMLAVTRPDGTFPQIGDNDDGRLANLDGEPVGSHRRHLAVGGAMFRRPDLLAAAGDAVESAVWLCGSGALDLPKRSAEQQSQAFPLGGFYVMRTHDAVTVIDAGEVGMRGIGGHGHNDVLSFDVWAGGAPVLVDSGTFTYTADPSARQAMRSTAAHNALRVDGEETSRLGGDRWLWLIENDAHPFDVSWRTDAQRDVFQGSHDGYRRLSAPVDHTRRISFDKPRTWWCIDDTLAGRGEHLAELFFHPAVPFDLQDGLVCLHAPRADLWLFPPEATTLRTEPGWISHGYGLRRPATVLVYAVRAAVPLQLRTELVLVPHGTPAADARSLVERD